MINNNMYIGGPKSLGGMYDWDIITEILNAKYPDGVKFSDETEASKQFTEALNKVQTDMVAKSNAFEERIASLGDSAALKGFVDLYKNPTTVVPVLATVSIDGSKVYTTTASGALTNVDDSAKKALLDNVAVNISLQYKYDHSDDTTGGKWIYGLTNALIINKKIGARDSTTTISGYSQLNNDAGIVAILTGTGFQTKYWAFSSKQVYSYGKGYAGPMGYFRANEQLTLDSKSSAKYGVDLSQYVGMPYAEVTLFNSGEKIVLVFGG